MVTDKSNVDRLCDFAGKLDSCHVILTPARFPDDTLAVALVRNYGREMFPIMIREGTTNFENIAEVLLENLERGLAP